MSDAAWRQERGPGGAATPVCEIDGGSPGPTWLLSAAIHGDEYEGPEAIRRAVRELSGMKFPGRVIALPVANPMAYAAGVRCTPEDRGNLNRVFPGDANGSVTPQWADWLWRTFAARADRLIDLHAGGAFFEFDPVAGFYEDVDAPMAAVFGFTLWRAPPTPGVFSHEFRQRRGSAFGLELGFGGTRDEKLTDTAHRAIVRLVRGETAPVHGPIYSNHDISALHGGEWSSRCRRGQEIKKGDVVGVMHRLDGTLISEIRSPIAGRVLAFRRVASAQPGDLLVGIGVPE
ncbi:MAG: succinylglutamate desuccinylase/aspartoacylase family protein [Planctomycetes bacterium]|nr:succinylglutamate desuccinylase/aspartoacylase family protein [Planctomycetota bacterium]